MSKGKIWFALAIVSILELSFVGCHKSGSFSLAGNSNSFKTFKICPGPTAQADAFTALFEAVEGDTIEFCAGSFTFNKGMVLQDKRGITIKGAGKDQTLLSFADSVTPEGWYIARTQGLVLQGMTIQDPPQTGVFLIDSPFATLRDLRVQWSGYQTCSTDPTAANACAKDGVIGITPENSEHVLIEDSEVFGASLFGFDLEHISDSVVRRVHAEHNLIGIAVNNDYRGLIEDNLLTNNTNGMFVSTGPDEKIYGEKNIIRNNRIIANNLNNFVASGLGVLPRGLGVLMISPDQVELDHNEIADNDTSGVIIINNGLLGPTKDLKYDEYAEGLYLHDNQFRDNGGNPQLPDPNKGPSTALTSIVVAKNHGKSAHIVWTGAVDTPNTCTTVPTDADGVPLNQSNPHDPRVDGRTDERGAPQFQETDPEPACLWNAWKFDAQGQLKIENKIRIQNNMFQSTRPATTLVDPFVNIHVTSSNPPTLAQQLLIPASNDLTPHAGTLPALVDPNLNLPYAPNPAQANLRPSDAEVAAGCVAVPGNVNWNALAHFNCPRLDQYGLFADPAEPRHNPNGGGVPYEINTALFSDYAVKYRILFLPPGTKAVYGDSTMKETGVPLASNFLRTLLLPTGTVIAKTFAFRKDDAAGNTVSENVVETRLLIKRDQGDRAVWIGLPYIWTDTPTGRIAELSPQGGKVPVEFDYLDHDPDVKDANGNRRRYTGSTTYSIPEAVNCASCHGGNRREAGASPLSPKARYLNHDNACPNGAVKLNQLECLNQLGLLQGLPGSMSSVEKTPRWNVPGDSGEVAGSPADVNKRMRAYLEVNCSHCHTPDGKATVSFMYLDSFRTMNRKYGICKSITTPGKFGGRKYDIHPGNYSDSVLPFRDASNEPGIRMPPLARSITNAQADAMQMDWINNALPALSAADSTAVQDQEACTAASPVPTLPPVP